MYIAYLLLNWCQVMQHIERRDSCSYNLAFFTEDGNIWLAENNLSDWVGQVVAVEACENGSLTVVELNVNLTHKIPCIPAQYLDVVTDEAIRKMRRDSALAASIIMAALKGEQ